MPQQLPDLRGQQAILGLLAPPEMRLLLLALQDQLVTLAPLGLRATSVLLARQVIQVQLDLRACQAQLETLVLLGRQVILDQLVRQVCLVRLETLALQVQQDQLVTLDRLDPQVCPARQVTLVRQVRPELLGLRELILLLRDQLALPAEPALPDQLVVFQTQLR